MLPRREDWLPRLKALLDARTGKKFEWGRNDCALFACDGVEAETGIDLALSLRGHYRDGAGARRALRALGYGNLELFAEAKAHEFGLVEVEHVGQARMGDVALRDSPIGPALGIVLSRAVVAIGENGLAATPLDDWRRAWRIG